MDTPVTAPPGGRRSWWGALALLLALGTVEVTAVAFLGHRFLPAWLAWALDSVGVVALVATLLLVGSVLWRRHRVGPDEVLLVLGWLGDIRVPRGSIAVVRALPPLAGIESDQVGPLLRDGRLLLSAAVGPPRVEVSFAEPVRGRRLWQRAPVDAVVVTDPEQRLAAALAEWGGLSRPEAR